MANAGVTFTVVFDGSAFAYCVFDEALVEQVFLEHLASRGQRSALMRGGPVVYVSNDGGTTEGEARGGPEIVYISSDGEDGGTQGPAAGEIIDVSSDDEETGVEKVLGRKIQGGPKKTGPFLKVCNSCI